MIIMYTDDKLIAYSSNKTIKSTFYVRSAGFSWLEVLRVLGLTLVDGIQWLKYSIYFYKNLMVLL